MNTFSFEECYIGQKESFSRRVVEEDMGGFLSLTSDVNPLHQNKEFARNKGFEDKVVYGLLTTSFFSTLVGVFLPGENCLIQEVNWKFLRPVYVNDELLVTGEVIEKDDRTKQLFLKTRIYRVADNALLVRGKMVVGVI